MAISSNLKPADIVPAIGIDNFKSSRYRIVCRYRIVKVGISAISSTALIRGSATVVLAPGVNTSDGNTSLLGGNVHELARDQTISASTGGIHRLKSNTVKGTSDTVGLLGQDLLDGVGGVEYDRDSTDGLSEAETVRHLVHGVDARSTTKQSRVGGEETHGSGTKDGNTVPRLEATVGQCMPASSENIGDHQVVHLLGEVARLVIIRNRYRRHFGKRDTGILAMLVISVSTRDQLGVS